jgi:hypothetical protein
MTRFRLTSALLLAALLLPNALRAQEVLSERCAEAVYGSLASEQRLFRSVLYGQREAATERRGALRYDNEGLAWIKLGTNQWRSLTEGYENTTWSDALMDERSDPKPRRGILERKEAVSSDVIPEIAQSIRALQCRLRARCMAALESRRSDQLGALSVKPPGCIEMKFLRLQACTDPVSTSEATVTACDKAVETIIDREMKLLELTMAYDAAYRSLLQLAGIMDGFLEDFQFPLLEPLWRTVDALSGFKGMTCFLSQCDE